MFFIRWISHWPLGLLHACGATLGWLVWALSPTYRKRLRANARLAGVPPRAQRQAIGAAGRMVAETLWLWLDATDEDLGRLVQWRGAELVDEAIAAGRPLMLLTPHMGSFEICARAYAARHGATKPITVLYRPAKSRALREFQEASRQRPTMPTAPANLAGVRQMLRALKRREVVGLLPDQVPPDGQGVWAPFFGLPAYTMTLAVRLIQQTGADCIVLRGERLPRGRGYVVHASRLVRALPPGNDPQALEEAASTINETMEQVILQDPGQYLWGYNRYKQPRPQAADAAAPEGGA